MSRADPNSPYWWLRPLTSESAQELLKLVEDSHKLEWGFASVTMNQIRIGLEELIDRKKQMSNANNYQVDGNHYKEVAQGGKQHWDRAWEKYREAWFVLNITKYIERYRAKDGIKDLLKAKHYLEKLIELEESELKLQEEKIHAPGVGHLH